MTITRTTFEDTELREWWMRVTADGSLIRNTFFQTWEWNVHWFRAFVEPDARRELVLLKVKENGRVIAVAPFFLQLRRAGPWTAWRYLLFIGDRLAQYTDIVITTSDLRSVWVGILDYLRALFPDAWLLLHDVLPESTIAGLDFPSEHEAGDTYLRIPLGGENETSIVERMDPHMQREIRRGRRLFEQEGAFTWEAVHAPDPSLVEELIRLNRMRFGPASWFTEKVHRDFFLDITHAAGKQCVFTVLRHEGTVMHLMASWVHGDSLLYVLSGMDPAYRRFSPGTMNLDRTIRYAMNRGCTYFDFLRGDEPYKQECVPQQRQSEHCILRPSRTLLRYRAARAVQRLMRARMRRREAR
ncbi:MAG: GNAT family N-acetyltransferase [Bacteroidetes bacterium]|nr:GNAT family N-acetyltransferase [Bacteroidota bacterium]